MKKSYIILSLVSLAAAARLVTPRSICVCSVKVPAARAQIGMFMVALESYQKDIGRYPSTKEGLVALIVRPRSTLGWTGPYLEKRIPADPWGRAYIYEFPGEHGSRPDVVSYGADGRPGGKGRDSDIESWKLD